VAEIGVTVMETGVTEAGTGVTMMGIGLTMAVVHIFPTGRAILYKATNAKRPDRKISSSRHSSDLQDVRTGSQNQVGHTEN